MKQWIFCILLSAHLSGDDFLKNQLEVGEIFFDGNKIVLTESFQWQHPLGMIQAKSAEVLFDPDEESTLPKEISMQEGVSLEMKDGGRLSAPYAWLSCRQWTCVFHGHEGNKISYQNQVEGVSLESLRMELNFVPPNKDHLVALERLIADGSVEITLKDNTKVQGARAVFDQFSTKGEFGKASLAAEDAQYPCCLTQEVPGELMNRIESSDMLLDLKNETLLLEKPKGVLQKKGTSLRFEGQSMRIDKGNEELVLYPPVKINWFGELEAQGKAEIRLKNKALAALVIQGPAFIHWNNPQSHLRHQLAFFGLLSFDAAEKKGSLVSPENAEGKVKEEEQIAFKDNEGEIFADRAFLDFVEKEGRFEVVKIQLLGNVRLIKRGTGREQYALADEAILELETKRLTLLAKTRPKVLFYDELNKVHASAPGLIVNRDPKTGKELVQGIGTVRFVFAEEELNELKKRFSFEPKK